MSENNICEEYDVIVIGGGPGGYVAAIRAAQLGFKTACVEMRDKLGGTCLNVGCIPSKALLHSSHLYHQALHDFGEHGISANPKFDLKKIMQRKLDVVDDLTKGIAFLFKKNKVTQLTGKAKFIDPQQIEITDNSGKTSIVKGKNFIIATGSVSTNFPGDGHGLDIDEKDIVSSTGALSFSSPPKHLVIIGAGVIGLELGSVWARLGSQVTVVEYLDKITPNLDKDIGRAFQRILTEQGINFHLQQKVTHVEKKKGKMTLHSEAVAAGDNLSLECDKILVAIGRKPYVDGLGLDKINIQLNDRGFIECDGDLRTSHPHIYAIGDCVQGAMLAHRAEDEGMAVAERIAGQKPHINYDAIAGVIYTSPEVANVGFGEDELKQKNIAYKVGKFNFIANSRARANGETAGLVKILADKTTDRVLGAYIIGAGAGEMIQEIVTIIEFGGSAEDIARICHAHPTFSEAVREAALNVEKRQIHA